ncbi:ketopantoate reductase family protein [Paraburkholderia hospita]|jgi:2-dehydropantoate 2-reductase|uniref:ketopantoate reductase family protein n=1 Tax=Paraburkholderia hospita TaxID=169430 RepID=UPI000DEEE566|nr:ketopantoate reductase family protein [Paraburkholderia hospita]AXF03062.1 2-dehydropantoate 2-reductase [Paraburkholderia hospita]
MRAAIIGAGSLGTIIGALITRAGKQIDLIDTYREHVEALNSNGATITGAVGLNVPVVALTPDEIAGHYDLVFLLTKQTDNRAMLSKLLAHLHADSIVCTLQNGIPEHAVAEIVGAERTVGGAVGFGATWIKPGVSSLTSSYDVIKKFAFEIGEIDGAIRPRLTQVQSYLECVGATDIRTDLMGLRFSKLLMNTTFSGMSAALGCTFGDVLNNSKAMTCLAFVADECIKVAHAHGVHLVEMQGEDFEAFQLDSASDIPSKMPLYHKIWGKHAALKASMLQDLEKGRETEIRYINGLVSDMGRERGVATPFNDKIVELVLEAQTRREAGKFEDLVRFDELLSIHSGEPSCLPGLRPTASAHNNPIRQITGK